MVSLNQRRKRQERTETVDRRKRPALTAKQGRRKIGRRRPKGAVPILSMPTLRYRPVFLVVLVLIGISSCHALLAQKVLQGWDKVPALTNVRTKDRNTVATRTVMAFSTTTSTTGSTLKAKKKKIRKKKRKLTKQQQSQQQSQQEPSLAFVLQQCTTPQQVLEQVGVHLVVPSGGDNNNNSSNGTDRTAMASLTLIRLSKQLMTLQNEYLHGNKMHQDSTRHSWNKIQVNELLSSLEIKHSTSSTTTTTTTSQLFQQIIQTLVSSPHLDTTHTTSSQSRASVLEPIVEGTKAVAILARLLPDLVTLDTCQPLLEFWTKVDDQLVHTPNVGLPVHQLSGLQWAYACLQHAVGDKRMSNSNDENDQQVLLQLPNNLQQAYQEYQLPFCIIPGFLGQFQDDVTVDTLVDQVEFQVDTIRTTSTQRQVQERRETAWEGDEDVAPFAYSGKSMPRHSWSPWVKRIRDQLAMDHNQSSDKDVLNRAMINVPPRMKRGIYYDGCLLNHYPDGGSAMRYHSDPDQGTLWSYETAVVSIGASRRVAFRETTFAAPSAIKPSTTKTPNQQQPQPQPHTFVVMHGDAMVMVDDCQERYQHAVKPADNKREQAARASLVFKRTLSL